MGEPKECFDVNRLEELIQLLKQDKNDKPYIDDKAKQVLIEIGNHFLVDLMKKGISVSKNKTRDREAHQDNDYDSKQQVEVNDFRIIAETKYNTKIDGANSLTERAIAQSDFEQQRSYQDRLAALNK